MKLGISGIALIAFASGCAGSYVERSLVPAVVAANDNTRPSGPDLANCRPELDTDGVVRVYCAPIGGPAEPPAQSYAGVLTGGSCAVECMALRPRERAPWR